MLRKFTPVRLGLALLIVIGLAGVIGGLLVWRNAQRELVFVVPPGSSARLAAGEEVTILPDTILIALDRHDTLVIRNEDSELITIGPFNIAPGQQYRQRFYAPGSYDLTCSVHNGGQLRLVIQEHANS